MMKLLGEHTLFLLAIQRQALSLLPLLYTRKSICTWLGGCRIQPTSPLPSMKTGQNLSEAGRMSGLFLAQKQVRKDENMLVG